MVGVFRDESPTDATPAKWLYRVIIGGANAWHDRSLSLPPMLSGINGPHPSNGDMGAAIAAC